MQSEIKTTVKFTANELNEIFGFNPESDVDFEHLNIAAGSEYQLNLYYEQWQVITNGLLQGSFDATYEDVMKALNYCH